MSSASGHGEFTGVAADGSGNVYAAGFQIDKITYSYGKGAANAGAIAVVNPTGHTGIAAYNAVVVKYAGTDGTPLLAQGIISATVATRLRGVALDGQGNVYAAGYQRGGSEVNYGNNVKSTATYSGYNAMIVKYDSALNAQWAMPVAAASADSEFYGIAVDGAGLIYAAGYQTGTGSFTYDLGGASAKGDWTGNNAVVVQYDSAGTALWARAATGGGAISHFNGIAADSGGNVTTAGYQNGTGTFKYGPGITAQGGLPDAYGFNAVVVWYR
jgi:hypothetical protein